MRRGKLYGGVFEMWWEVWEVPGKWWEHRELLEARDGRVEVCH